MSRSESRRDDGTMLGRELSTAVVLFHEAVARLSGLSAADHKALDLIGRTGPQTAGEIARATDLSPAAVTGLVDRLEGAGYVRRARDPADRRRVIVSAVPNSRKDIEKVFAELSAAMGEMMSRYDARQQALIEDYVTRTIEILREQTRRLSRADRAQRS